MAYEIASYAVKVTLVAGADLSSDQYKFVKMDGSGGCILVAAATDRPVGILQNAPRSGEEAEVLAVGGSKVITGTGGLTDGAVVKSADDGTAIATVVGTDTTHYIVGTSLVDTAAGEYATVLINCPSAGRAA